MTTTLTTKLAGHLKDGDTLNVHGEPAVVSSVEVYEAANGPRVEFILKAEHWTSALDIAAGDAVWLHTDLSLDDEEDADAETFTLSLDSASRH